MLQSKENQLVATSKSSEFYQSLRKFRFTVVDKSRFTFELPLGSDDRDVIQVAWILRF
jgi:hypothetical protein